MNDTAPTSTFGEVGEQHRQAQPDDDLEGEAQVTTAGNEFADKDDRRQRGDDLHHEHDRILEHNARVQLGD